ncbi:hypothetical protein MMC19_006085 [Ptychographa xylographoides]|nr:hypothetical protein [Ptychographa xylographoides]
MGSLQNDLPPADVLITGATGHIGFRVLVEALQAGYSVRAAIRSSDKSKTVLAAPSIKKLAPGTKLSFVIVPDILADGAYDEAVKGVKYIIHLASPLPVESDDAERDVVQPAIKGTIRILESAKKNPAIERVVITSSVVAVISVHTMTVGDSDRHFVDDRVSATDPPYGDPFVAYAISKVKALRATEEFVATEKPHFDVINIHPGWVIGANELATDAGGAIKGTNGAAMGHLLGMKSTVPRMSGTVHLHDVAKIHVLALDPKIPGGQSFATIKNMKWNDNIAFVKREFPDAVKSGKVPVNGDQPTLNVDFDASNTEKVFGIKFQGYEEATRSVVEQYVSLLG